MGVAVGMAAGVLVGGTVVGVDIAPTGVVGLGVGAGGTSVGVGDGAAVTVGVGSVSVEVDVASPLQAESRRTRTIVPRILLRAFIKSHFLRGLKTI